MRIADLVEAQRLHLDTIQARATVAQLRVVRAALDETMRALGVVNMGSWGEASQQWTRLMLIQGYRQLAGRMTGRLGLDLLGTVRVSARDQAQWFRTLDRHFSGAVRPLKWDTLQWVERQGRVQRQTRLRMYRKSFARYGAAAVTKIEDAIAKRVLVGDSWDKAMGEVGRIMEHVSEGEEWRVRRTVDTETAAVYNGTAHDALIAEDTDPRDPMQKRLVAVWDHVTAKDSMLLDGQTRPVRKPFYDSYHGREYMHPPNRPHDREQVVGWRKSWGDDMPHFSAPPEEDIPTEALKGPRVKPVRPRPPRRPAGLAVGAGAVVAQVLLANRRAREDALRQISQATSPEQQASAEQLLAQVEARGRQLEREADQAARAR